MLNPIFRLTAHINQRCALMDFFLRLPRIDRDDWHYFPSSEQKIACKISSMRIVRSSLSE